MQNQINTYIPEAAVNAVHKLLNEEHLVVKVKNERKTRHGDYRQLPDGNHQITVNST